MRSIEKECLGRLILFGENSLCPAIRDYLIHYHGERNHQGMGNQISPPHTIITAATIATLPSPDLAS